MNIEKGYKLIEDLIANPNGFFNSGKSYDLLNAYFKGLPIETLVPLLTSLDINIQKSAIWIASELTVKAGFLLPYIVRLVNSDEKYIKYYALECVFSCSKGDNIANIVYLINSIDDNNIALIHSMKLISNADETQLRAGINALEAEKTKNYQLHIDGLSKLNNIKNLSEKDVIDMINSDNRLIQRYGAIIIEKGFKTNNRLVDYALKNSNLDVKEYLARCIE